MFTQNMVYDGATLMNSSHSGRKVNVTVPQ